MVSSKYDMVGPLTSVEYFQKPNEKMINNQVILNQMNSDSITVKTEVRQKTPLY